MIPLQCNNMAAYSAAIAVITTILLLFPAPTSQAQILKTQAHVFGPFNQSYFNTFAVLPSAAINLEALQVTPDSTGNVSLANRSGRVFFNTPFTLWDDQDSLDGKLVSFNTSFLINVYRPKNETPGEGMAFFIAPSPSTPPLNSHGEFLGLTNASTDGNRTNQIVAVELDTVKQDFDPDDNHIGLDINGVRSNVTVSLTPLGFEIAPNVTRLHVLWVEYHGDRRVIDVYIAEQADKDAPIVAKPAKPVLSSSLDLKQVVNRVSYFGFSASTGDNVELNCVLRILDAVDPRLGNDCVAEEAERALKLGLACSHPIASERPKMQTIVQIISGSVPVPHVPPFKPAFVWPAMDLSSLASELTQTTTTEYTPMNSTTHSTHVDFSDSGSLV
ncbi:hypothetical protein ACSQ67_003346 [Phaseolus vulgaris]